MAFTKKALKERLGITNGQFEYLLRSVTYDLAEHWGSEGRNNGIITDRRAAMLERVWQLREEGCSLREAVRVVDIEMRRHRDVLLTARHPSMTDSMVAELDALKERLGDKDSQIEFLEAALRDRDEQISLLIQKLG